MRDTQGEHHRQPRFPSERAGRLAISQRLVADCQRPVDDLVAIDFRRGIGTELNAQVHAGNLVFFGRIQRREEIAYPLHLFIGAPHRRRCGHTRRVSRGGERNSVRPLEQLERPADFIDIGRRTFNRCAFEDAWIERRGPEREAVGQIAVEGIREPVPCFLVFVQLDIAAAGVEARLQQLHALDEHVRTATLVRPGRQLVHAIAQVQIRRAGQDELFQRHEAAGRAFQAVAAQV